jgi:murein tripeptide amidase MpaA
MIPVYTHTHTHTHTHAHHTQDKPALILTGRVHPGESNASLMMHGMLEFLLSPSQYATELRRNFLLYVVPMLNPDGVILGNCPRSLLTPTRSL